MSTKQEQQVKDLCNKLDYYFTEYDGSHFVVDTCDKRLFHTGNHWITAHINRSRNQAIRFILKEMALGTHIDQDPCDDGDCEYCR
jgi:hypothetical protein